MYARSVRWLILAGSSSAAFSEAVTDCAHRPAMPCSRACSPKAAALAATSTASAAGADRASADRSATSIGVTVGSLQLRSTGPRSILSKFLKYPVGLLCSHGFAHGLRQRRELQL